MSKTAIAVIGAAFGDEGKGLMTDYFAAQSENCIVVRYNGGGQAGHTVVTPEGERHVFSHFGSGTLAGASTYLSQFFIAEPASFLKEYIKLAHHEPTVYLHPDALITTPFDMLINQFAEKSRGWARHGSCGMGVNETVVRSASYNGQFTIRADHLKYPGFLKQRLKNIRDLWVPIRMKQLGIEIDIHKGTTLRDDNLIEFFLSYAASMAGLVKISGPECLELKDVVFEGAQGLLLDEEHHFFPHVTRSKTGLKNILTIAAEAGITDLQVNYVIRAYLTRHGNGAFPSERETMQFKDDTNNPNEWQGSLRFGALDLDLIGEAIDNDKRDHKITPRLIITHMDQVKDTGPSISVGGLNYNNNVPLDNFYDFCRQATGINRLGISTGPTRNDIKMLD